MCMQTLRFACDCTAAQPICTVRGEGHVCSDGFWCRASFETHLGEQQVFRDKVAHQCGHGNVDNAVVSTSAACNE